LLPPSFVELRRTRRRCAPRNDERKHSRGTHARVMHQHRPSKFRGHREDRAPLAPMGPVQQKKHGGRATGSTGHPAFPCAMVYGLSRALPGVPGILATVALRNVSQDLIPASGDQDHTPLPSASASVRPTQPTRPSHPAANVRDDRDTPLLWSRTRKLRPLICPTAQAKIFVASEVKQLNSFESAAENRRTTRAIFGAFCKHARRSGAALTHWFRHPPSNWCR
jgi:hypothetical protein